MARRLIYQWYQYHTKRQYLDERGVEIGVVTQPPRDAWVARTREDDVIPIKRQETEITKN